MNWTERDTCYILEAPQLSDDWRKARMGAIQASKISYLAGRSKFNGTGFELVESICSITESYSEYSELAANGILKEPEVRNLIAERLECPVKEVGLAVWKEDPIFRASLDGETTFEEKNVAVEIKVPKKLYRGLIDYVEACRKGVNNKPLNYYIFRSHYDQMTAGSVITGKEGCLYAVACYNSNDLYTGYVPTDRHHFDTNLYPVAKRYYKKMVLPYMKERGIELVMPKIEESFENSESRNVEN